MTERYIIATLRSIERNPGASRQDLENLEAEIGWPLPEDYLAALSYANGFVGSIPGGHYIDFWSAANIPKYNNLVQVQNFAPGLLLIGSDGGSMVYGIDLRNTRPEDRHQYVKMDDVVLDWEELFLSWQSLEDLFKYLTSPL